MNLALNRLLITRWLCLFGLCLGIAGCATTAAPSPTPTATATPTVTPPPLATSRPTGTPRPVATWTPTITPTRPSTNTPVPATQPPTLTPTPSNRRTVGQSTLGRPIEVWRYGNGPRVILLVGGVHGGWESNTVTLMNDLRDHFESNSDDILDGFAIEIIPAMNPDGLALGQELAGRFNANNVDLNRNWACGWQPEAQWRQGPVDPGPRPFSEPETGAVAAYIGETRPVTVLFYHSAADGVFAGDCPLRGTGAWRSGEMSAVYGEAAGYSYGESFSAYPVTGTAASWVDGLGIPSADVELSSASDAQTDRNLRGVLAVQCWLRGIECE